MTSLSPTTIRETVREGFVHLLAGGLDDLEYYENPVLTRSGEEHLIAWYNTVLKDQDGNIVGVLSSGEDITERRAVDEELRRHTEVLALFNSLNDSLNRGSSLKELVDLLADGTRQFFSCYGATVYLVQNDRSELEMQNITIPQPLLEQLEQLFVMPLPMLRFKMGSVARYDEVIEENRPVLLNNMTEIHEHMDQIAQAAIVPDAGPSRGAPPFGAYRCRAPGHPFHHDCAVDGSEQAFGLLEISRRQAFNQEDLERFAAIAQPLSAAIQRKQADDALRESEARYRQLFENAPVGLGICR